MDIYSWIGRIHPVLVHLPIGILLLGLFLFWRQSTGWKTSNDLLALVFLSGAVTATLSALSGYALSLDGDHEAGLVSSHRNAGILLTAITWIMWWLIRSGTQLLMQNILSFILLVVVIVTGHQGGSLTHGKDFLFPPAGEPSSKIRPLVNVEEAVVYKDVIDPILQDKCVACHGPQKQKGKLKLDSYEHIMKGGKHTDIVVAGNKEKSLMLQRIMLPPDDEDHMPPKEKSQLTQEQTALIEWWITNGAGANARVRELKPDAGILKALASFAGNPADEVTKELHEVKPADAVIIERLRRQGAVVVPIEQGSNLLHVNLLNCTEMSDSLLASLGALKEQLFSLKAEGPLVNDSLVMSIRDCANLHRLSLAKSSVTKASATRLTQLPKLETLNLYGTALAGVIEKKDLRVFPSAGK